MIVAWEDFRDEQGDIYAQLVPGDFPTAIQWSLASATAEPGRVVLVWQGHGLSASSPIVQRRGAATEWRGIGEPRLESGALVFEDRSVSEGRYAYRLVSARDPHDVLAVEVWVAVPGGSTLALVGFTPNPAPRSPVVSFSLSTSAPARLELFDVGGRQVRAQEVGGMGPGAHHLAVARDQPLAAGVYWLRLSQQGRTVTAKGLIAQ